MQRIPLDRTREPPTSWKSPRAVANSAAPDRLAIGWSGRVRATVPGVGSTGRVAMSTHILEQEWPEFLDLLDSSDMTFAHEVSFLTQPGHSFGKPAFGRQHPLELHHDVLRLLRTFMEMVCLSLEMPKAPADALSDAPVPIQIAHVVADIAELAPAKESVG